MQNAELPFITLTILPQTNNTKTNTKIYEFFTQNKDVKYRSIKQPITIELQENLDNNWKANLIVNQKQIVTLNNIELNKGNMENLLKYLGFTDFVDNTSDHTSEHNGGKTNIISILGRRRRVIKVNDKSMITYKGNLITLKAAYKLEKQRNRNKQI